MSLSFDFIDQILNATDVGIISVFRSLLSESEMLIKQVLSDSSVVAALPKFSAAIRTFAGDSSIKKLEFYDEFLTSVIQSVRRRENDGPLF
jgi:hypothetical protein